MYIQDTSFTCLGCLVSLKCGLYGNGRLAIQAIGSKEPFFGVLTVNLPNEELGDREIFVKSWSENKEFAECAMKTGLFVDTGRRVPTGFVEAEVWRLADGVYSSKDLPVEWIRDVIVV